jgi:superfamily II DNA helicase RecQ
MAQLLLSFITIHPDLRVAVCSVHGSSYVRANLREHLRTKHLMHSKNTAGILEYIASLDIADGVGDVSRPVDGRRPVSGLPIHVGYTCITEGENCRFITINKPTLREHRRNVHRIMAAVKGRPQKDSSNNEGCSEVRVQTLFAEKQYIDYFTINTREEAYINNKASQPPPPPSRGRQQASQNDPASSITAKDLQRSYLEAQDEYTQRYNVVSKIEHVSELTTWLRVTGYQDHIEGIEVEELPASYQLPVEEEEPVLSAICSSIARVLRKAMAVVDFDKSEVRRLSRLNSRLLNTLLPNTISTKPFRPLQNQKSKEKYVQTFQKLLCYYSRVSHRTHLQKKKMFVPTSGQRLAWSTVEDWAEIIVEEEAKEKGRGSDDESMDELTPAKERLDRATLDFSLELLQHVLSERVFDSAIISWLVVLAWDAKINTWMKIGNYTSYLSQIVYDCRLLLLQHCISTVEEDPSKNFTECLIQFRDKWVLNDTHGPLGELLSTKLIGQAIANSTVEKAQVYWNDNGETIVYQEIELPVQGLRDLVQYALSSAVTIFKRDLCFQLDNIPEYPINDIAENINERRPGASFITDIRNAARFQDGLNWLFQQVIRTPALSESFIRHRRDEAWYVQGAAVAQYEASVQQFLEYLFVVAHVASGQPGRRSELLGIRWCNKQADTRSIFMRDGYVIFALSYHKSMNLTNAARFPVRAFLPEAGVLLIQYLVLVIPFRKWLLNRTKGSSPISEYLWSNAAGVWPESRMTRVLESVSKRAIGIRLDVQSYRQIAIGIAIKKFAGLKLDEGVKSGSDSDGEGTSRMEGSMPEVFHLQASHTVRTGNRAYGGTINFNGGLTDAAVQEFIYASQVWHGFIMNDHKQASGSKHDRSKSTDLLGPLAKRIALRGAKQYCRRHWTMEETRVVLRTIHPQGAYKSLKQEQAVRAVVQGLSPVIVILGTGAGKSLVYQLQQKLPGAGVTVLLLPLVSVKQDTIGKCLRKGVHVRVWGGQASDHSTSNSLVIASLDQAVGKGSIGFQNYLHKLNTVGQLNAIVIDECHLLITTASYREKMALVKDLREYSCQLIFLSATLPICYMGLFKENLLLLDPVVVRGLTVRKDLAYSIRLASTSDLVESGIIEMKRAMAVTGSFAADEKARGIVYCKTKAQVCMVADELDCLRYYSDAGTEEEKSEVLQSWIQGDSKLVVATTALTEGIDYSYVRIVCYIGPPESATEFIQGTGRAGRDGEGGTCFVVLPKGWRSSARGRNGELLPEDAMAMERFLDGPRCRVLPLAMFQDGVAQYCDQSGYLCDMCTSQGFVEDGRMGEETEKYRARCVKENGVGVQIGEARDTGVERLRAYRIEQEERQQMFKHHLDLVQGRCVICLARGKKEGMQHNLDECREQEKWAFFQAKKRATGGGKKWIMGYKACFRCGLHQRMCPQQGKTGCKYKDIVMPLSWSGFRLPEWEGHVQGVAKRRRFADEQEYMRWLGQGARVFDEDANNMVAVCDGMLERIVRNLLS